MTEGRFLFGYVSPKKGELKIREFSEYRAVYCSLCRALRSLGFGAKLFLNYDFVFAAMLFISLSGQTPTLYKARCNTNPLEKVRYLDGGDEALDYCAAALVVTSRYKLLDDREDERGFRRLGASSALLFTRGAYKKARAALPAFDECLAGMAEKQRALEAQGCAEPDAACDPGAAALRTLFEAAPVPDGENKKLLGDFGYMLGRFVYLADALDDLEKDLKTGRYNPFIHKFCLNRDDGGATLEQAKNELRASLRATQAAAESRYRLLSPVCFKPILDNIVYLGLLSIIDQLPLDGKKKGNEE